MRSYKILFALFLGVLSTLSFQCTKPLSAADESTSSTVVPIPEADQAYSSPTPLKAIVVDKQGNMTETEYTYDPEAGGVVINNEENIYGDGSSLFFPALEVGFLWAGGYWVDHEGYYWNGNHYANEKNPAWHDQWDHYWNRDWNNKWNNYRQQHPQNFKKGSSQNRDFNRHGGVSRPAHAGSRGGRSGHRD
jgi:hypothetical protein